MQVGKHTVKPVGLIRKGNAVCGIGHERQLERFIASAGRHDVFLAHPDCPGDCPVKIDTGGIAVQTLQFCVVRSKRRDDTGRRRIRGFICIQFDEGSVPRDLPGNVRLQ